MARDRLTDFLQVGNFHILDVSFTIPMVMLPVYGFARCSAPEMTMEMYRIKEGNFEFSRKVIKSAEVSPITLEQGVRVFNSDFGDWVRKSVVGRVDPKDLMLVQFTRLGFADGGTVTGPTGGGLASKAFSFEFVRRIPGRAWILKTCRPSAWRPTSDFDGSAQDISIASLTLEYEELQEMSLGI